MEGVQFLVDDKGEPTSVVIGLAVWGDLWEVIRELRQYQGQG